MPKSKRSNGSNSKPPRTAQSGVQKSGQRLGPLPLIGPVGFPDHWVSEAAWDGVPWVMDLLRQNGLTRAERRLVPKCANAIHELAGIFSPDFHALHENDKKVVAYLFGETAERIRKVRQDFTLSYTYGTETVDPRYASAPEVAVVRRWAPVLKNILPRDYRHDTNEMAKFLLENDAYIDEHFPPTDTEDSSLDELDKSDHTSFESQSLYRQGLLTKNMQEVMYELWSRLNVQLTDPQTFDDEVNPREVQLNLIDRLFSLAILNGGMPCMRLFLKMYPQVERFFTGMLMLSNFFAEEGDDHLVLREGDGSEKAHVFSHLVKPISESPPEPLFLPSMQNSSPTETPQAGDVTVKKTLLIDSCITQSIVEDNIAEWAAQTLKLRALAPTLGQPLTLKQIEEMTGIVEELNKLKATLSSQGDRLSLEIVKRIEMLMALLAFASKQTGEEAFGWLGDTKLLACIRYEWLSRLREASTPEALANISQHILATNETVATVTLVARSTLKKLQEQDRLLSELSAQQARAKTLKDRQTLLQQRRSVLDEQARLQSQMVELESNLSGLFETAESLSPETGSPASAQYQLAPGQDVVNQVVASLLGTDMPGLDRMLPQQIDRFYSATVEDGGVNTPLFNIIKVGNGSFLAKTLKGNQLVVETEDLLKHKAFLKTLAAGDKASANLVSEFLQKHEKERPSSVLPPLAAADRLAPATSEKPLEAAIPEPAPTTDVPVNTVTPESDTSIHLSIHSEDKTLGETSEKGPKKSIQKPDSNKAIKADTRSKVEPKDSVDLHGPATTPEPLPGAAAKAEPVAESAGMLPLQADSGFGSLEPVAGEPARTKRAQPADNSLLDPVEVIYWSLIAQGRMATAVTLSDAVDESVADGVPEFGPVSERLPDIQMTRLNLVASHLTGQLSPLAEHLSEGFSTLASSGGAMLTGATSKMTEAYNLVAAGSLLRPLLLAQGSGAPAVASMLSMRQDSECAYRLVKACMAHGEVLQPFQVNAAMFKSTQNQAEWESTAKKHYDDAKAWFVVANDANMQYVPATRVWLHWFKPGGHFHVILQAMKDLDVETVRQKLAVFHDIASLEKAVQFTDRNELDRRVGENILRRSVIFMMTKASDLVEICRKWVPVAEAKPNTSESFTRVLMAARNELWDLCTEVENRFSSNATELPEDHMAPDEAWALDCAKQAFKNQAANLKSLFNQNGSDTDQAEPSLQTILQAETCYLVGVTPGQDSPTDTIKAVLTAWENSFDVENLFKAAIDQSDLKTAAHLLSTLGAEQPEALKATFTSTEASLRTRLKRQIDAVRASVEAGLTYGYITEAERAQADATLVHLDQTRSTLLDFHKAFQSLQSISEMVSQSLDGRKSVLRERIAALPKGADAKSVERIAKSVDNGDILTANEWLQQVQSGGVIPDESIKSGIAFARFFPSSLTTIEKGMEAAKGDLRSAALQRRSWLGLPFDALTVPQSREANACINSWLDTHARRRIDRETMRRLVQILGLEVINVEVSPDATANRAEALVYTTPIQNRDTCAVPYFGSAAKGIYRLICIWPRAGEEDVIKHIGDASISRPTIVLYFGTITERRRRELAKACRTAHKSFLVVDEPLAMHLIAYGSAPENFFATTTAFTNVAPYDATSSVVPAEMFFGRTKELSAVMSNSGQCFIYGGRQLGKTALMLKAESDFHKPNESRFSAWIDLRSEGIGVGRAPADIWSAIYKVLMRRGFLDDTVQEPVASSRARIDAFIDHIHSRLQDNKQLRILLLLDEADKFFEVDAEDDFTQTRRLKQLMEGTERRFKPVFAGLHNVLRMTTRANHPLAHLGEPVKIGPLLNASELRDAYDLITKPFEAAGYVFESPELITRVLAQTNYYPSLIQLYCSHLMRHLAGTFQNDPRMMNQGPLYKITAEHVDTVYLSRELRKEIREKFHLTLQLDDRYEVIAYALALASFDNSDSVLTEGLSDTQIRNLSVDWWKDGFTGTSNNEFRVLLEEMDGLGVLRQLESGNYVLRNPNIVLLLGKREEIENNLLKDREVALELDRTQFRARPSGDTGAIVRSPLTMGQSNHLTRSINDVSVVFGNAVMGVAQVGTFIKQFVPQGYHVAVPDNATLAQFRVALENLRTRKPNGTTVLVVSNETAWTSEWVQEAKAKISSLRTKAKEAHVVFIADADKGWRFVRDLPVVDDQVLLPVDAMTIQPWSDAFLAQWLADCGLPGDLTTRQEIRAAMGIWANGLSSLATKKQYKSADIKAIWTQFAKTLKPEDAKKAEDSFIVHFGNGDADLLHTLKTLASLDQVTTLDDLVEVAELDRPLVVQALKWAELNHVVKSFGTDGFLIDPTVKRLMDAMEASATVSA